MASAVLRQGRRSMRIIALPLTTASRIPNHEHLTYYHFVTPPPREDKGKRWSGWVAVKAAELWAGFGKAPEGNWKRKTFLYGERLVDRIDFEELALKSVDPSLGPKLINFGHSENESSKDSPTIPLIYPGSACTSPISHLRSLLEKRTPRHKRGFIMWMIIAPLTAPFMLIPVIPNLPFFFCVWRSWSHYRAYKASSYLEKILDRGAIVPEESTDLDKIYTQYAPALISSNNEKDPDANTADTSSTSTSSSASTSQKYSSGTDPDDPRRLILTREAVPAIMATFDLRQHSSFANDVYRALEQARLRMAKGEEVGEKRYN